MQIFSQPLDLSGRNPAGTQQFFERLGFIQPAHDDQPVPDMAARSDRVARGSKGELSQAEIDIRRQPCVEDNLGPTRLGPARQRGKIEVGKPYRFLELVDVITRHENPGHMGLARNDRRGHRLVAVRTAQERYLAGQGERVVLTAQVG